MALILSSTGQGGMITLKGGSFGGRFTTSVTPAQPSLLLDTYAGAAAAYSLRKLRTAYTGAAIRVRRSSDNTETDIGFNGSGGLDTTSLTTFCGSGDGFVSKWYDQSVNARDAINSELVAQPTIFNLGNIILQNGKPAISFDGSNDTLKNTNSTILLRERSFVFVGVQDNPRTDAGIISFKTSGSGRDYNSTDTFVFSTTNNTVSPLRAYTIEGSTGYALQKNGTGGDTLQYGIYLETKTSGEGKLYQNNILQVTDTSFTEFSISNTQGYNLGSRYFTNTQVIFYFNGKFQEFIYWEVNNILNRNAINTNINSYYSIY